MFFLKQSIAIIILGAFLFALQLFAFSEPSSSPPLGNVPAPLNVSSSGQSKSGGLVLNTGGALNGLIVDQGNVGIGTQSPTQKLDVIGYVRGATGLCIGSDCRTGWQDETPHGKQFFTSNGSFTIPSKITKIWVTASGGGGGGAGGVDCSSFNGAGGGGGGGGAEVAMNKELAVTQGTTIQVSVGSGGAGGGKSTDIRIVKGQDGGATSFGSLLSVAGGEAGGNNFNRANGGKAGGWGGLRGFNGSGDNAGIGGDSLFGLSDKMAAILGGDGKTGTGYGAGGSGGNGNDACGGSSPTNGGPGAPGFLLVEW